MIQYNNIIKECRYVTPSPVETLLYTSNRYRYLGLKVKTDTMVPVTSNAPEKVRNEIVRVEKSPLIDFLRNPKKYPSRTTPLIVPTR